MDLYNDQYLDLGLNKVHITAIIGDNVTLGKGNIIMPYAVIGEVGFIRGAKSKGKVIIGDNNKIGCHCAIMSGEEGATRVGSNNLIMNFVNIGHDSEIKDDCEIGAGSILSGFTKIMSGVKVKVGVTFRNRITIGFESVIGMGSVVVKDVHPRATVYGNPAKCKED